MVSSPCSCGDEVWLLQISGGSCVERKRKNKDDDDDSNDLEMGSAGCP